MCVRANVCLNILVLKWVIPFALHSSYQGEETPATARASVSARTACFNSFLTRSPYSPALTLYWTGLRCLSAYRDDFPSGLASHGSLGVNSLPLFSCVSSVPAIALRWRRNLTASPDALVIRPQGLHITCSVMSSTITGNVR